MDSEQYLTDKISRLEQRRETLQQEWDELNEKLGRLCTALVREDDEATNTTARV